MDDLKEKLEKSWAWDTAYSDEEFMELFDEDNPARDQCLVTALVVQDYLGGEILHATVCGCPHFYNRLDDGTEIDYTRSQFEGKETFNSSPEVQDRARLLEHKPTTKSRYKILKGRVDAYSNSNR